MLRLFMNGTLFYSFDVNENNAVSNSYVLTGMTLKKEINSLSTLVFNTLITHDRVKNIHIKRSLFVLADDNTCLFIGKPLSINRSILEGTIEVECEELLGCLRDEVAIDVINPDGDNKTERTYLTLLTNAMNGFDTYYHSERDGIFGYNCELNTLPNITKIGMSTSVDPILSDKTTTSYMGSDFLSIIYSTVNSYTGGVIFTNAGGVYNKNGSSITYSANSISIQYRVDLRDSLRDTDGYLDSSIVPSTVMSNVDFQCGTNIISIEREESQKYPISVIVPYASYIDIGDNKAQHKMFLKKANVYNSSIIENVDSVNKYGRVSKSIDFGDLGEYSATDAESTLHALAVTWASWHLRPYCEKYIVNGIDKYYYNKSATNRNKPIDVCDIVQIDFVNYAESDELRHYFDYVLSLSVNFFDHEQDQYIIGPYIPDNILDYNASNIDSKNAKYGEAVMATVVPGIKGMRAR